jgi:hypothetical protein
MPNSRSVVPPTAEPAIDPSQVGKGNWACFKLPLETVYDAGAEWRRALQGVTKPWLCWHVSDRWCTLQQRLIQQAGWTPVIGFDPRIGPPATVLPGSVVIDFNARFGFEVMWPHFPLEFAFLFAEDRLAFWHADLLVRIDTLKWLAGLFESLPDDAMAAVLDKGGRRNFFRFRHHRYWELAGCVTRGASESQFRHGCGWWRYMRDHPKCTDPDERRRRAAYYYDSGVGIMYWKRRYGGRVTDIPLNRVAEGHCTSINRTNYRQVNPGGARNLGAEIDLNFDIAEVAARLGIAHLL